jgi:hypothetical protein
MLFVQVRIAMQGTITNNVLDLELALKTVNNMSLFGSGNIQISLPALTMTHEYCRIVWRG